MSAQSSIAPERSTFDENAAAVVKVLMATADLDAQALAPRVGMTKSTMYLRLRGKPWLASELDRIAAYFNVGPAIFFTDVSHLLDQNRKKMIRADLRVVDGSAEMTSPRLGQLRPV